MKSSSTPQQSPNVNPTCLFICQHFKTLLLCLIPQDHYPKGSLLATVPVNREVQKVLSAEEGNEKERTLFAVTWVYTDGIAHVPTVVYIKDSLACIQIGVLWKIGPP